jgi:hypothetical protein
MADWHCRHEEAILSPDLYFACSLQGEWKLPRHHLGELPRSQLVIRVVPRTVVSGAQDNGGLDRAVCGWSVDSLPRLITLRSD